MRLAVGYRQWALSFTGRMAVRLGYDQALLVKLAGAFARAVTAGSTWSTSSAAPSAIRGSTTPRSLAEPEMVVAPGRDVVAAAARAPGQGAWSSRPAIGEPRPGEVDALVADAPACCSLARRPRRTIRARVRASSRPGRARGGLTA